MVVNSGVNTVTGEKGDASATGPTGATGATGPTGASGSNGATWYSGAGQPSATIGATGDYYLDTTSNAIYRKDAVGTWIKQTNLQLNNKADYDSGWVNLNTLAGQNITLAHNLNTTNLQNTDTGQRRKRQHPPEVHWTIIKHSSGMEPNLQRNRQLHWPFNGSNIRRRITSFRALQSKTSTEKKQMFSS